MLRYLRRLQRRLEKRAIRYRDDKDGVAAIEFAIVALPFFMLLFGIIELAIIFFLNSAMTHAVSEAGRSIRTGNFQACGGAAAFKQQVCAGMKNMMDCESNVRIDVLSQPTFKNISMPDPEEAHQDGTWTDTVAGQPVVIRALFYYELVLPAAFTRMETHKGSGIRILESTTAFRNEPFPAGGGVCPG